MAFRRSTVRSRSAPPGNQNTFTACAGLFLGSVPRSVTTHITLLKQCTPRVRRTKVHGPLGRGTSKIIGKRRRLMQRELPDSE